MSLVLAHQAAAAVSASSYSACFVSTELPKQTQTLARFLISRPFFWAASVASWTFLSATSAVSFHSFLVFCQSFSFSALVCSQSLSAEVESEPSAGMTLIWWRVSYQAPVGRGGQDHKLTFVLSEVSSSDWRAPSRSSWLGSGISPAGTGGQGQRSRRGRAARAWEQAAVWMERSGVKLLTVVLGDFGVRHCGLQVRD